MKVLRTALLGIVLAAAASVSSATGVLNVLLGANQVKLFLNSTVTGASSCPASGDTGYSLTSACGSISSATDSNGRTLTGIYTTTTPPVACTLVITGFVSNPTQTYFAALLFNGKVIHFTTTASSYSYSTGVAEWTWTTGGCSALGSYTIGYGT